MGKLIFSSIPRGGKRSREPPNRLIGWPPKLINPPPLFHTLTSLIWERSGCRRLGIMGQFGQGTYSAPRE